LDQGDLAREKAAAGSGSGKQTKKKGACLARPRQNSIEGALAGVGAPDFARALGMPALPEASLLQGLVGAAGLAAIGLLAPMMAAAGGLAMRGGEEEGEFAGFSLAPAGSAGLGPLGSGGFGPGVMNFSLVDGLSPPRTEGALEGFTGAWAVRFDAAWPVPDLPPVMLVAAEATAASALEVREPPRSGASRTADVAEAPGGSITAQPIVQGGSAEAPTTGRTGVASASPAVQAAVANPAEMAPGFQDHGGASSQPTKLVPAAAFAATASDVTASRPGRPIEAPNEQAADRRVPAVERQLAEARPAHATGPAHEREVSKDVAPGPLADKAWPSQAETVLAAHPGKGHGKPFEKLADAPPPAVLTPPPAAEATPVAHPGKAHPGQGERKQEAEFAPASTALSTVLDMGEMPSGKAHGRQHHRDAGQEPMPVAANPSSMEPAFAMHPGKGQDNQPVKAEVAGPPEALVLPFVAGVHVPAHAGKEQGHPADKTVGRFAEITPDPPAASELAAAMRMGQGHGNRLDKSVEAASSPPAPFAMPEQQRGKARDEAAELPAGLERASPRPEATMPEGPSKGQGHQATGGDADPVGSRAVPAGLAPESTKPGRAHEEAGLKGPDPSSSIVVVMADMMAPVAPQSARGKPPGAEAADEVTAPASHGDAFAWNLHRPEQGKASQGGKGHDAGLPDAVGKAWGLHPAPFHEVAEASDVASRSSHDWNF
ncbi:MAG TPA: hypothetical protein VEY31_08345, partial [Roseococcus sp.]|nr:hypothetical protein [Roseococcus sp.]